MRGKIRSESKEIDYPYHRLAKRSTVGAKNDFNRASKVFGMVINCPAVEMSFES